MEKNSKNGFKPLGFINNYKRLIGRNSNDPISKIDYDYNYAKRNSSRGRVS